MLSTKGRTTALLRHVTMPDEFSLRKNAIMLMLSWTMNRAAVALK